MTADEALRAAEREAEAGGLEERTELLKARRSAGLVEDDVLALAAFMGDASARSLSPIGRYGLPWEWNDDLSASAWISVMDGMGPVAKTPGFKVRCAAACLRRVILFLEAEPPASAIFGLGVDPRRLGVALSTAKAALAAADAWASCPCVDHAMAAKDACKIRPFDSYPGPTLGSPAMLVAGDSFVTHDAGFTATASGLWWWRAAPGIAAGLHGVAAETALSRCTSAADEWVPACDAIRDEVCAWLLFGRDVPAEEAAKR